MKKICMLCWVVLCSLQLCAQDEGVRFQGLAFQEALNKAKAENKLVFMDCYTSWCGPCKYMLNTVFVLPEIGAFFNDQFVNVKYDMEKGEGPWLRGKFHVNSYPTFLILRPDGTLQHRIVGSRPAKDFLECVKRGAKAETSQFYLDQLYRQGKLEKQQLVSYHAALRDAKRNAELKHVTGEEFKQLSDDERCLARYWYIYDQEDISPEDERFVYMLAHKTVFDEQIGKEIVDKRIYDNYFQKLTATKSNVSVSVLIALIKRQIASVDFEKKEEISLSLRYVEARNNLDIDAMLDLLEKRVRDLPRPFLWQVPFLDFILGKGNKQQVARYMALENKMIEAMDNETMKKAVKETFIKYRSAQN
ncbi:thioredoxin family protein [Butyricimonas paravirosa]|uniref:thioredoxin family protein n=1 Tax=Butyricimonas paravirosa TaxID=1472417 RepID=UPI0021088CB3|nr:thioredoxin family protein [Butyricimonas paravirosa]MCQ4872973.1 thioredoxin family protein [Butyricimonas paravirosa]